MSTIVMTGKGKKRRHAPGSNGKPLCGGGHGAKKSDYQIDLGDDINCEPCRSIIKTMAKKKALQDDFLKFPWTRALRKGWTIKPSQNHGQFTLHYRNRFDKQSNFACTLTCCDERLALVIAQGLNAIFPTPPPDKTGPNAAVKPDYEI